MNWLKKFMIGRYGPDQLSVALIALTLLLSLIFSFFHTAIVSYIAYIPFLLFLLRSLSKNFASRRKENEAFLKFWKPVSLWLNRSKNILKDSKTHKYFKCPGCKQTMRVPKGKGKICITCPKCKTDFIKKT